MVISAMKMKLYAIFGILTISHMIFSIGLSLVGYDVSVIDGEEISLIETMASSASSILIWPGSLVQRWARFEDQIEWLIFILNSMLWALVATGVFFVFQKSNIRATEK